MNNNNFQKRIQAHKQNIENQSILPIPTPSIKVYFDKFNYNLINPSKSIYNCFVNVVPIDTLQNIAL